ncbi:ATP-binding cassette sub-family A member 3, partial [Armadillidium vulgare]
YFVASWSSSKFESVLVTQSIIILSLVPFWYLCADGLSELYSAKIFSIFFPSSCFAFVLRTLLRFEIFGVGASFALSEILRGTRRHMKLASKSLFMRPSSVQKDILNIFEERKTSIEKALSGEILKTVEAIALQKLFMINGKPFLFGENLSFEMFENQVHVFYGPPKSGKTTILSMIAGISQPSSGYISVCGLNPSSSLKRNLETVSFSPSETSLGGDLTVYEIFYYFSFKMEEIEVKVSKKKLSLNYN